MRGSQRDNYQGNDRREVDREPRGVAGKPGMLLVGLVGATGAGKTTLAGLLVERCDFVRAHMGQPIKDMLAALGLSDEQLTGPPEARSQPVDLLDGRTPRYAMQTLGTEWGRRMVSQRLWANAVERRLMKMREGGAERVVIDDLRFPSDFEVVARCGGMIVSVVRFGVSPRRTLADRVGHRLPWTRTALQAVGRPAVHETEYHWHDADAAFSLANDGSPNELLDAFLRNCEARGVPAGGRA